MNSLIRHNPEPTYCYFIVEFHLCQNLINGSDDQVKQNGVMLFHINIFTQKVFVEAIENITLFRKHCFSLFILCLHSLPFLPELGEIPDMCSRLMPKTEGFLNTPQLIVLSVEARCTCCGQGWCI